MARLICTSILALNMALCCLGQDAPTVQVKVVKESPFSATAVSQVTQVLQDGNHITRSTNSYIARDKDGRTRREQVMPNGDSIVFLQDPVAGFGYVIDSNHKSVRRFATSTAQNEDSVQVKNGTSLGSRILEGVQVEGTQLAHTVNVGEAGNERTLDVVVQVWYSSELQTVVRKETTDPRVGETTYKLTNIQRDEPDASLFQIPDGFSVRGEVATPK